MVYRIWGTFTWSLLLTDLWNQFRFANSTIISLIASDPTPPASVVMTAFIHGLDRGPECWTCVAGLRWVKKLAMAERRWQEPLTDPLPDSELSKTSHFGLRCPLVPSPRTQQNNGIWWAILEKQRNLASYINPFSLHQQHFSHLSTKEFWRVNSYAPIWRIQGPPFMGYLIVPCSPF